MPIETSIETINNQLLTSCYELLLNRNNTADALNNIVKLIASEPNVVICGISIFNNNLNKVYRCINKDKTSISDEDAQQLFAKLQSQQLSNPFFVIQANAAEGDFIHKHLGVQKIIGYIIHIKDYKEQIVLAFKNEIDENIFLEFLKKLSLAISNVTALDNFRIELYSRNEVYETTLSTLNQIIWDYDLKTSTIHVMGFAPRIGNFIPQKTFVSNLKNWYELKVHPNDKERVIQNFEHFILQKNNSINEIKFRMLGNDESQYIWVQTMQTLLYDETGTAAMIVGTTADIQDSQQIAIELAKHKTQNEELVFTLQETNEKLVTILNSSKEIIFTIDLQTGLFENVNKAIQLLGYSPKEWVGQNYLEWSLEKRKKFHQLLKHASESDYSVKSQHISFATKDEEKEIPFEFSTSIFSFKDKKYLLCVLRDITERIKYEESIKQVTEQLTHLINNIDDVYAIYNLKLNKYEFVSNNIEFFFGCSKDTYISKGLYWNELIHPDDYLSVEKQINEIITNKTKGEFFYRIVTPVGETKMLLEKITVDVDKNGNADKIYIVKSDYTNIENAEQNLIESERKFRFISENITDFISIIDIDGRFMYASPSSENVIGYTTEELIGKNSIYIIHPEDIPTFIEEALEKTVFDKNEVRLQYRINKKDGSFNWVETFFKPIIDNNNQTSSIICSTRDVTEREQLMKDLEQALQKERALNELRSQFVSMASHQFRTPLTVIQSGVELMQIYLEGISEQKQQPFKKQFKKIESEVLRLQDLMNDVLLLGRADAKRTPYNPTYGSLLQFCKDFIESRYNNQLPDNRKVILYSFGTAKDVYFDAKLLDHTFENIFSNAYKYSDEGNIKMTLTFNESIVTIAIQDFGIGIPQNEIENLIQPFYRASNTLEIEGTGLGLSIVNEFIEKHGGKLFVESQINKGTTVNIELPIYNLKT
jgi:PAS domain S-box-containing protein